MRTVSRLVCLPKKSFGTSITTHCNVRSFGVLHTGSNILTNNNLSRYTPIKSKFGILFPQQYIKSDVKHFSTNNLNTDDNIDNYIKKLEITIENRKNKATFLYDKLKKLSAVLHTDNKLAELVISIRKYIDKNEYHTKNYINNFAQCMPSKEIMELISKMGYLHETRQTSMNGCDFYIYFE